MQLGKKTTTRIALWGYMGLYLFFAGTAMVGAQELPASDDGVVYPDDQPGLIYIEGEDAVSTNFAQQPTLDYGSSGQRMIQLNRFTAVGPDQDFFADFVFLVNESGSYQFWVAGTPPGPRDQIFPSYISPFSYSVDDGPAVPVYREDVAVNEQFGPINFWYLVGGIDLNEGIHRIRFSVNQKRRFDSKYYFFLDSFFLLKDGTELSRDLLPAKFPKDLSDRSIDNAYRSINEYEYLISQDPENVQLYITFSQVYSLLGDYLNALKYLIRGLAYEPENPQLLKLVAKNRIWKGDVIEGLNAFDHYLELYPDNLDTVAEAAKIAAWTNRFTESYRLYEQGLAVDPNNFNLKINLGLTYLWNSKVDDGLKILREVMQEALADPAKTNELARLYLSNSYPSYAVDVYEQAVNRYPRYLEFYLGLSDAYELNGQQDKARSVIARIPEILGSSDRLQRYVDAYNIRRSLKDRVIQEYRDRLAANPDDLVLREQLVQTLFWNGQKQEAVDEYLNIMGNKMLLELRSMEQRSSDLLEFLDESYAYRSFLAGNLDAVQGFRRDLQDARKSYRQQAEIRQGLEEEHSRLAALEDPSDSQKSRLSELPGLIDHARSAEDDAGRQLADIMDSAENYIKRAELVYGRSTGLSGRLEELGAAAAEEQDRLENLSSQISWSWNREDTFAEIDIIRNNGNILGDYLKLSIDRDTPVQDISVTGIQKLKDRSDDFADGRQLAAEFELWKTGELKVPAGGYYSYGADLESRIGFMGSEYKPLGLYSPDAVSDDALADLDALLVDLGARNRGVLDELDGYIRKAHEIYGRRLEFAMYLFDTGTYLTRYQIGEYYLNLGQYKEAERQFRAVLRIDPYNANARFRLGSVKQLAGDWSGAMKDYRQVYGADPGFENVRQLYNQLARENATVLQIQARTQVDTSRWNNRMSFNLDSPVSTWLGIRGSYHLDDLRLHKPPAGESPSTASLQGFDLSLALRPGLAGLELTPPRESLWTTGSSRTSTLMCPLRSCRRISLEPCFSRRIWE